jgi:hypothetical protein
MRVVLLTLLLSVAPDLALRTGADPVFPLRVGPGGRALVDQRGAPFLVHGDTPWSLTHNLTYEEALRYLDDRKARGFNALLVSAPDAYDPDGSASFPPDRYGNQPFEAGDWTRPVEAYWAHVERVLRATEERGFLLLFAPAYLGCCGDGYVEEIHRNGPERMRAYGRWVGRRFGQLSNVLWVHGGDRPPNGVEAEVRAMASGIHEVDPHHLHTGHWNHGVSALSHFSAEGWLDVNSTYTYGPVAWRVLFDRAQYPRRPTFLIESHYESDIWSKTAEDVRVFPYRAVLAGATGAVFGNKPLWFCGTGWEAALASPGARSMQVAVAFLDSREWWRLEPDREHRLVDEPRGWRAWLDSPGLRLFSLVRVYRRSDSEGWLHHPAFVRAVMSDRRSFPRGDDSVLAAATPSLDLLVAHVPSRRVSRVSLGALKGPRLHVWWFDPRSGQAHDRGEREARGFAALAPPGEGDWLLVVDDAAARRGAPGAPAR